MTVKIVASVATGVTGSEQRSEEVIPRAKWDALTEAEKKQLLLEFFEDHKADYLNSFFGAFDSDGNIIPVEGV